MNRRCFGWGFAALGFLPQCRRDPRPSTTAEPKAWRLLESPWAQAWRSSDIPDQGEIAVRDGVLQLSSGQPMTGATFTAWQAPAFPETNYAIQYEARRVQGEDIFGMVTFPVGSHQAHATFVLGGWGGTVTGISSIDFADANENSTRAEQRFENERWYRIRLEVRPDDLRAWVDDRLVVNVRIQGRRISLRPGFIDHCVPFGFATYGTHAEVRSVEIRQL